MRTVCRRGVEHKQAGSFGVQSHFAATGLSQVPGTWGPLSPFGSREPVEEEPALLQPEGEVAQPGPGGKRGGFRLCSAFGSGPRFFP